MSASEPNESLPRTEDMQADRPVHAQCLEINEVADGLIVYQPQPECVHHLNSTAAVIFDLCDGQNTVPEISDRLALAFGLAESPLALVKSCVSELRSKGALV